MNERTKFLLRQIILLGFSFAFALLASACGGTAPPTLPADPVAIATEIAVSTPTPAPLSTATPPPLNPLTIEWMRRQEFPGSDIAMEQTLAAGSDYNRYVVSYKSEGLKIYALMTVPKGTKPKTGWPVIVFNHGYIPPSEYRTTERYVAYVDAIAKSDYIVFKSDYRGHGNSEGVASGAYATPGYTLDVLNAMASLKKYKDADPNRVGMWGHSMGGQLTLRSLVAVRDIKAAVIWAGVVAPYTDLLTQWRRPNDGGTLSPAVSGWRQSLSAEFGSPEQNPQFWNSISPNSYVADISAPIQIHHGTADASVPIRLSEILADELKGANKSYEFYRYPNDDHNISKNLTLAMQRTVAFFDRYVKGK